MRFRDSTLQFETNECLNILIYSIIYYREKGVRGESLVRTEGTYEASHRGRLDIIANILASAIGGIRKTSIMYKCNLSFKQLEVYLMFLNKKGLLNVFTRTQSKTGHFFETTEQGMDFLKAYRNLKALMIG